MNIEKIVNKLSKLQKFKYSLMNDADRYIYLSSLLGKKQMLRTILGDDFTLYAKLKKNIIKDVTPLPIDVKVYQSKGELQREFFLKNKARYDVTKQKYPDTQFNDWLGIEIECYFSPDKFRVSTECDGSCREYCECYEYSCDHCGQEYDEPQGECECECTCETSGIKAVQEALYRLKIPGIQVVGDGSLSDDYDQFGVEIKVLTRLSDSSNLKRVCDFINENGGWVNDDTGLHVHTDVRSMSSADRVIYNANLVNSLQYLKLMVPSSRYVDGYNELCSNFDGGGRQVAINCHAIKEHGSIECRLHSGTTNFDKIVAWCTILQGIKEYSVKYGTMRDNNTLDHWIKGYNFADHIRLYILKRINKFNPEVLEAQQISLPLDNIAACQV